MSIERIQKIFNATGLTVKVNPLDADCFDGEITEGYVIDGVYLTKENRPVTTIAGDKYVDFWVVGHDIYIPGGHWEPDDYDYTEVGDFQSLYDAVSEVCRLLIKWKLDNYGECEALESMMNEPKPEW